ncbi:hypothetical protein MKZ38_005483 [Zalerion maritima]|uniref:Subtelomeric hrmA-associated cluster protein AFUB-079030/YDR124W-like helical bundle domain-containing protein n=1 Tax=Zalerion maritima TaxID=339359 RepID=A0AAD5RKL0_9PEZI|nr:hypothetical protein MKZ38_005483 [Zalerion maritima]
MTTDNRTAETENMDSWPRKRRCTDGIPESEHSADDSNSCEWERPITEAATELEITIGNSQEVLEYYAQQFRHLRITACKLIAKAWIKQIDLEEHPVHPYTGDDSEAPAWWPKAWGPTKHDKVRYMEPDTLHKEERVRLLCHILQLVVKPNGRQHHAIKKLNLSVQKLQNATSEALDLFFTDRHNKAKKPYLYCLFHMARQEERHLRGEVDTNHTVLVPKGQVCSTEDGNGGSHGLRQQGPPTSVPVDGHLPSSIYGSSQGTPFVLNDCPVGGPQDAGKPVALATVPVLLQPFPALPPVAPFNNFYVPLQPTFQGFLETKEDALLLIDACFAGALPFANYAPRKWDCTDYIRSGNIFVFQQEAGTTKRWIDGLHWSPGRETDTFCIYRQLQGALPAKGRTRIKTKNDTSKPVAPFDTIPENPHRSERIRQLVGSLINNYDFKPGGLVKKTKSITRNGVPYIVVSYYDPRDILDGKFETPSQMITDNKFPSSLNDLRFISHCASIDGLDALGGCGNTPEGNNPTQSEVERRQASPCAPIDHQPPPCGPGPGSDFAGDGNQETGFSLHLRTNGSGAAFGPCAHVDNLQTKPGELEITDAPSTTPCAPGGRGWRGDYG